MYGGINSKFKLGETRFEALIRIFGPATYCRKCSRWTILQGFLSNTDKKEEFEAFAVLTST